MVKRNKFKSLEASEFFYVAIIYIDNDIYKKNTVCQLSNNHSLILFIPAVTSEHEYIIEYRFRCDINLDSIDDVPSFFFPSGLER